MIPKNQTFENTRRNLLSAQRGMKEPTRPKKYRRGGVNNSGASLQPPRPDPQAGITEKSNAQIIGMMNEFLFGKDMLHDQYRESEREKGIASWERATVEQREGYEKAIKNKWINSKESTYFRESVTNAYTDNLVHKASLKMWTDYEKWPDKNNPNSGSLQAFFQQQEDDIAINLESIPDETLKNRFYEQWQAQKRELTRKHGNYLNAEYNAKAQDEIDNKLYNMLEQYDDILSQDFRNSNIPLSQMLDKQRYKRADYQEIGRILESFDTNGKLPQKELNELRRKSVTMGGIYRQVYEGLTHNIEAEEPSPTMSTGISSEDINIIAKEIIYDYPIYAATPTFPEIPIGAMRPEDEVVQYLEVVSSHAPYPSGMYHLGIEEKVTKQKEFQMIVAKKPAVNVEAEVINSWLSIDLKGGSAVAVAEHSLTTKGGPLITKGGGANGTLPVFLATSKDYPKDVKEFANQFALSLEKQPKKAIKIWHGYLDEYYSGKKGAIADIWKKKRGTKEKWFVGNWEEANFNVIHFKTYVTKLEEEGKI